jgi:hypothetical protein
MGFRNATVRRLGVPDLTTTVLTMTLTGLAADAPGARSVRRAAAVVAMVAGAALGAWLVRDHGLGLPLLITAVVVGSLAVVASGRE